MLFLSSAWSEIFTGGRGAFKISFKSYYFCHILARYTRYFLLTAIQSLTSKAILAIIVDLKRWSSSKYKCSYCAFAPLGRKRGIILFNSQIIWFVSFFPLSFKHVSPPRGLLESCIDAYFIPSGFNQTDQSHHSSANHQHNSKVEGLQCVQTPRCYC